MDAANHQAPREREPDLLSLPRSPQMSSEQFWETRQINRDWRLERTAEEDVVIRPPAGALTGSR